MRRWWPTLAGAPRASADGQPPAAPAGPAKQHPSSPHSQQPHSRQQHQQLAPAPPTASTATLLHLGLAQGADPAQQHQQQHTEARAHEAQQEEAPPPQPRSLPLHLAHGGGAGAQLAMAPAPMLTTISATVPAPAPHPCAPSSSSSLVAAEGAVAGWRPPTLPPPWAAAAPDGGGARDVPLPWPGRDLQLDWQQPQQSSLGALALDAPSHPADDALAALMASVQRPAATFPLLLGTPPPGAEPLPPPPARLPGAHVSWSGNRGAAPGALAASASGSVHRSFDGAGGAAAVMGSSPIASAAILGSSAAAWRRSSGNNHGLGSNLGNGSQDGGGCFGSIASAARRSGTAATSLLGGGSGSGALPQQQQQQPQPQQQQPRAPWHPDPAAPQHRPQRDGGAAAAGEGGSDVGPKEVGVAVSRGALAPHLVLPDWYGGCGGGAQQVRAGWQVPSVHCCRLSRRRTHRQPLKQALGAGAESHTAPQARSTRLCACACGRAPRRQSWRAGSRWRPRRSRLTPAGPRSRPRRPPPRWRPQRRRSPGRSQPPPRSSRP